MSINRHLNNDYCIVVQHLVLDDFSLCVIDKIIIKRAIILYADQNVAERNTALLWSNINFWAIFHLRGLHLILNVFWSGHAWTRMFVVVIQELKQIHLLIKYISMCAVRPTILKRDCYWNITTCGQMWFLSTLEKSLLYVLHVDQLYFWAESKNANFSLPGNFNDVFCISHFYFASLCNHRCTDMASKYSFAFVVSSTSFKKVTVDFESSWLFQFWLPDAIQADSAFSGDIFKTIWPRKASCSDWFLCIFTLFAKFHLWMLCAAVM